jgi:hypothetical protein
VSAACPAATQVLRDLLADEHAAVYGYGVLGARLDPKRRRLALAAYDAHRAARDDLRARLLALHEEPPASAPSYAVQAATPAEAVALAVRLEEGLAVRWRDLVAVSAEPALRGLGVQQLQDCAVRAAQWRGAPVPFPGRP